LEYAFELFKADKLSAQIPELLKEVLTADPQNLKALHLNAQYFFANG